MMGRSLGDFLRLLKSGRKMNSSQADSGERPVDFSPPDEATLELFRLHLAEGVGPLLRKELLNRFETAEAIFDAAPDELRRVPGIGPTLAQRLALAREEVDIERELDLCRKHGISLLSERDAAYPRMLRELPDPPGFLFVRGEILPRDAIAVAIVGTRHPTRYGLKTAKRLAAGLARQGVTIVSGLARGIDAAAHQGALEAGGRTLAVLGSGVLNVFPPEHDELAESVVRQGAVLSESPPEFPPIRGAFPQRNRIISGLTCGVIIVEAAQRSGALITARLAMEQNREVFAVPGQIDCRMAAGPHRLIRDGAKLVESIDDVLEELGPLVESVSIEEGGPPVRRPSELSLNEIEQKILALVETEPTPVDRIISHSGLAVPRVLSTLNVLERNRLVERLSGAMFVRK